MIPRHRVSKYGKGFKVGDKDDKTQHKIIIEDCGNDKCEPDTILRTKLRTKMFNGYQNTVGERTNRYDTEESSTDDGSMTDDGFIVDSEGFEDGEEDYETSRSSSDDDDNNDMDEKAEASVTKSVLNEDSDMEDSDISLPSVSKLLFSSAKCNSQGQHESMRSRPRRSSRRTRCTNKPQKLPDPILSHDSSDGGPPATPSRRESPPITKSTVEKRPGASGIVWAESSDEGQDDIPFFSPTKRDTPLKLDAGSAPSKRVLIVLSDEEKDDLQPISPSKGRHPIEVPIRSVRSSPQKLSLINLSVSDNAITQVSPSKREFPIKHRQKKSTSSPRKQKRRESSVGDDSDSDYMPDVSPSKKRASPSKMEPPSKRRRT
ncbi:hypothetical protein GGR57DRAFT_242344 [Xylariaceae sp. FL1272]|nr:hypothetical protein GGR57DRAFT_242344 [Xylariaceae sp. FL1272]